MVIVSNGYVPETLAEALTIRNERKVIPYAGGTDLMVWSEDVSYLFLNKLQELKKITEDETYFRIGAGVTFTQILRHPNLPQALKDAVRLIASPATRNMATPGGNICNASPKADSALIFYGADSLLRLCSTGGERTVTMDEFYVGRGKTVLRENEIMVEILLPKANIDQYFYQKVGARRAMAISRVSFVGFFGIEEGKITRFSASFGSVADVILRFRGFEALLIGKTVEEAKALKSEILAKYDEAIVPIRGRVSADYRKRVCMNLLEAFFEKFIG